MAVTYSLLDKYIVGSGGIGSVVFNNISQGYTDLELHISAKADNPDYWCELNFAFSTNSSTYSNVRLANAQRQYQSSLSTAKFRTAITGDLGSSNSQYFSTTKVYISNYTLANETKILLCESISGEVSESWTGIYSAWRESMSGAITSLTITPTYSGTPFFKQYSSFYLYGIAKA